MSMRRNGKLGRIGGAEATTSTPSAVGAPVSFRHDLGYSTGHPASRVFGQFAPGTRGGVRGRGVFRIAEGDLDAYLEGSAT